jgi:hypothetical protein
MTDDPRQSGQEHAGDVEQVEALLRSLDAGDLEATATPPPPAVWEAIQRELAASPGQVIAFDRRRRRRWEWMAGAAAAVALLVGGVLVVQSGGDDDTVLSSAVMEFDPEAFDPLGRGASARAELLEGDGFYEIRLTDAELPAVTENDDLELWLIEPDEAGNPVDVAPVALIDAGSPGTYRVPQGLDPASHYVVDISIEPRDGDAAHSGRSILRGALDVRPPESPS